MAQTKGDGRARAGERGEDPRPLLRLVWLGGIVLWALIAASFISFHPLDPPSHIGAPLNAEVLNWVGPAGAAISYHFFLMLGSGAWVVLGAIGAGLLYAAFRGPIDHPEVRFLGVLIVALCWSGMHALLLPTWSVFPEGAGGLAAIAGVGELTAHFGRLGAACWILLLAAIGATVAFDRWLVVLPRAFAWAGAVVWDHSRTAAGVVQDRLAERRAAIRANDVDDDARLRAVDQGMKASAIRAKRRKEEVEIDEDAGGLGGSETFDHEDKKRKRAPAVAEAELDDDAEEWEEEEYEDEVDDEGVPGAPQVFSEEKLREKIAKLPVRFASASKTLANEDDLDALRAMRKTEEEADRRYAFPPIDILEDPEQNYAEELESYVREQAEALESALHTYRIAGEVVGIESGPVITLYQVRLSPGTKVSSVGAVSSDIARMLKATNIRIVPNTEGLDTIGVEVPNSRKEKVRLKELMATTERTARMKLPLFLGKDASGNPLIVDLASLPHMLIAGTTGSGKSVCMNAIIMGFLYTQKPSDMKLVLVDPKMVELSQFKDIPHLMCPVVTEMGKAAAILEWAVTKMDERYELLAEAGCRDIAAYNGLGWDELKERLRPSNELEEAKIPRKLPYMVFIIDELADLMMTNKEVETSIVRIAQKARAVGIHLILATQRPQANVVTGLIKSNMPGRVAFKVASGMDSRIVLDQKGGELLLGQGDMLMLTPRSSTTVRAQGTLVDDLEIRRVVKFVRDNASQNFEGALVAIGNHGYTAEMHEDRMREHAQEDPLFDRAVELVIESRRGSVSMLQRRLAIGYTRAARLIEMMGEAGIIGSHKGTVAREVVISLEEWQAIKEMAERDASEGGAPLFEDATKAQQHHGEPDVAAPWEAEDDVEAIDDDGEEALAPSEIEPDAVGVAETEEERRRRLDPLDVEEDDEYGEDSDEDDSDEDDDSSEGDDGEEDSYEEEEDEEYEYEYVDEEGNPIDPDDEEYEYIDEEEEDFVDEEDEDEEDEDEPEVQTRPASGSKRGSAA
ncbi:MAG: DNA translocase FtsK [Phycisphaeraceae bacterium]|nr:MAG: DNA translocase FtsK [Phycisphaeraceae bacterium]